MPEPLTDADYLEVALVLNLLEHNSDDRRLREKAYELACRLRKDGKLPPDPETRQLPASWGAAGLVPVLDAHNP